MHDRIKEILANAAPADNDNHSSSKAEKQNSITIKNSVVARNIISLSGGGIILILIIALIAAVFF